MTNLDTEIFNDAMIMSGIKMSERETREENRDTDEGRERLRREREDNTEREGSRQ